MQFRLYLIPLINIKLLFLHSLSDLFCNFASLLYSVNNKLRLYKYSLKSSFSISNFFIFISISNNIDGSVYENLSSNSFIINYALVQLFNRLFVYLSRLFNIEILTVLSYFKCFLLVFTSLIFFDI
ncbi:hypothetical protein H8356DRAFT_1390968 [Neocallimastix lanati (nom. inval.)]|uniref:Uncharacterized protein n=1 Tax=Neocallimastix californiae TaxID=1754190 RepID=A0A1Y2EWB5_9FUNG|nr:hypothetical protein H8356DRAFT_1390968 [Neocallimastix sp. JGI-2020a]ORY75879.1 hypothetical protein LY90DRAFT_501988 [Neocallimastix californiae]|eukprot:ORY75879.1 hypothetical protein LY90DRAFT_501988 [Neocallimastix californiae]